MTDGTAGALPGPRPGRAVNEELRGLAVAAARHFGLAGNSVRRWVERFLEGGHVRPDPTGGGVSRIEPYRERIFRILAARPGLTVRGLHDALAAEGLVFGFGTVHRFLQRHRLERDRRLARLYRRRKTGRR